MTVEEEQEKNKRNFIRDPKFGYEYWELVGDTYRIRCEFFCRKSRLSIIDKVLSLKYHGSMEIFIESCIINQIEADLHSPETIAEELVKDLLKRWEPDSRPKQKSLQNATNE